ncbi:hypothetical protein [Streptomyces sp. NPDC029004]|uniref:LuxE/PaaK family acyltransferase n=1 Tax=Streptomyces sp. NPDC029004 TaxID=3154490 RepID=UPI0034023046
MTTHIDAGPRSSIALTGTEFAELDRLIFEDDDWWAMPSADQAALRHRFITAAVAHHLEHNADFRTFAESSGFTLADLGAPGSLVRVPQFPTRMFKRVEVRSVPAADCDVFKSSGTSGTQSMVWRDEPSLERLAGSLRPEGDIWRTLYGDVDLDDDGQMVHLGPNRREADGVWISYIMTLVEMFAATRSYVADGVLRLRDVVRDLEGALADGKFVCVAGPPVFMAELLRHMSDNTIKLSAGDRMAVITGGGWKKNESTKLDPDRLRSLAMDTFGLASAQQVRDVFNQVELNTAFIECEHHRKHVPPWVEVIVRDPRDLSPVPAGQVGLMSYLDPTARSYPCFLLAEDFGSAETDNCPCGRAGTTVHIDRRMRTSSHHGCALRLAETVRTD